MVLRGNFRVWSVLYINDKINTQNFYTMDTKKKDAPVMGEPKENLEIAAHDKEKELTAGVDDASKSAMTESERVEEAREVADAEIAEPVFVEPVPRHRGFMTTVLVILGICAVFFIANLFVSENRDKAGRKMEHTTKVVKQNQPKAKVLPGITVIGHRH